MCCKALVKEIGRALVRTDKNTQNVDLRGRLDPHGKRHGKVIPYKVSESRVLDILEGDTAEGRSGGLCGAMQDYQSQTSADGVVSLVKVFNNDGEAISLSGGVSIGGGAGASGRWTSERLSGLLGTGQAYLFTFLVSDVSDFRFL